VSSVKYYFTEPTIALLKDAAHSYINHVSIHQLQNKLNISISILLYTQVSWKLNIQQFIKFCSLNYQTHSMWKIC